MSVGTSHQFITVREFAQYVMIFYQAQMHATLLKVSEGLVPCLVLPHEVCQLGKIPFRSLQSYWKPCKYLAEPCESTCKYCSGVSKLVGSHANTSQSHVKTRANTAQEFLSKYVAEPRENTYKNR